MADIKISALPANAGLTPASDLVPIVHASTTESANIQAIVNSALAAPGAIGGTTPAIVKGTYFQPTSSTIPANGMYLSATNTLDFATNTGKRVEINATGNIGVGAASGAAIGLQLSNPITGAVSAYGASLNGTVQSGVTTVAHGYFSNIGTQATAFTCATLSQFTAQQATIGAGSTVTTQVGFYATSSLVGAGTNYGFRGVIPAAAGRYNLYMDGTAMNYIAGDMQLGKTVTAGGTVGARTINSTIGTVNFAAAATSLVVTNSLVSTTSVITATVGTVDTTMKSVVVVAAAGSFTITANAAATAETRVNFHVFN